MGQDDLVINIIKSRLDEIEATIYGVEGDAEFPSESVVEEVKSLVQLWNNYKEKNKIVDEYLKTYAEVEKRISRRHLAHLPSETKLDVIMLHQETIQQVVEMYKEFKELVPLLESEALSLIVKEENGIMTIQRDISLLNQVAIENDKKLKMMMFQYNQFVNSVSELFVKWDMHLSGEQ